MFANIYIAIIAFYDSLISFTVFVLYDVVYSVNIGPAEF